MTRFTGSTKAATEQEDISSPLHSVHTAVEGGGQAVDGEGEVGLMKQAMSSTPETAFQTDESDKDHSPPRLPLELIQHIVSLVNDKPSLARCCLVHSSLLSTARHALYSKISMDFIFLHEWMHPPRFDALYKRLQQHGHLADLVRSLEVRFRTVEPSEMQAEWGVHYFAFDDGGGATQDEWAREWASRKKIDLIARLEFLFNLPNLHALAVPANNALIESRLFPEGKVYPHIVSLDIRLYWPVLSHFFPSLAHLETFLLDSPAFSAHPPPPLSLQSLSVRPIQQHFPSHLDHFSWLTSTSSSSLTSLKIPFTDTFSPALSHFSSLHHLTVRNMEPSDLTIVDGSERIPQQPFPPLPPSLQTLEIGRLTKRKEKGLVDLLFGRIWPASWSSRQPSTPPLPPTLEHSFLSSLSCPNLLHLVISGLDLPAFLYAELVSYKARLPCLQTVRVFSHLWTKRERDEMPGWTAEEVEKLRVACEVRGVALVMPKEVKEKGKKSRWKL